MADSKGKLKENVAYERKKKRNYKTIRMFVSKMNSSICEGGDIKIKPVKKYNYLGSVVRDNGNCDTENRKCIRIAKYAFLKLSNVLKDKKMSLERKTKVLDFYVISNLYGSECWIFNSK